MVHNQLHTACRGHISKESWAIWIHLWVSAVLQLVMVSACVMTKGSSLSSVSICSCSLFLCVITVAAHCSSSSPCMPDLFGLRDLWISGLCSYCYETLGFDVSRCCICVSAVCITNNVQWEFLLELRKICRKTLTTMFSTNGCYSNNSYLQTRTQIPFILGNINCLIQTSC